MGNCTSLPKSDHQEPVETQDARPDAAVAARELEFVKEELAACRAREEEHEICGIDLRSQLEQLVLQHTNLQDTYRRHISEVKHESSELLAQNRVVEMRIQEKDQKVKSLEESHLALLNELAESRSMGGKSTVDLEAATESADRLQLEVKNLTENIQRLEESNRALIGNKAMSRVAQEKTTVDLQVATALADKLQLEVADLTKSVKRLEESNLDLDGKLKYAQSSHAQMALDLKAAVEEASKMRTAKVAADRNAIHQMTARLLELQVSKSSLVQEDANETVDAYGELRLVEAEPSKEPSVPMSTPFSFTPKQANQSEEIGKAFQNTQGPPAESRLNTQKSEVESRHVAFSECSSGAKKAKDVKEKICDSGQSQDPGQSSPTVGAKSSTSRRQHSQYTSTEVSAQSCSLKQHKSGNETTLSHVLRRDTSVPDQSGHWSSQKQVPPSDDMELAQEESNAETETETDTDLCSWEAAKSANLVKLVSQYMHGSEIIPLISFESDPEAFDRDFMMNCIDSLVLKPGSLKLTHWIRHHNWKPRFEEQFIDVVDLLNTYNGRYRQEGHVFPDGSPTQNFRIRKILYMMRNRGTPREVINLFAALLSCFSGRHCLEQLEAFGIFLDHDEWALLKQRSIDKKRQFG